MRAFGNQLVKHAPFVRDTQKRLEGKSARVWGGVELINKMQGDAKDAVQDDLPTKIMGRNEESTKKLLEKPSEVQQTHQGEQGNWLSRKVKMVGRRVQDAIAGCGPITSIVATIGCSPRGCRVRMLRGASGLRKIQ